MSIFRFFNYRECLTHCVQVRQSTRPDLNFQKLAEGARVSKSYLSKVLSGKANLSGDQLFLIAQELKLSEDETSYLELLLEKERCGVKERIRLFDRRLSEMRERHLQARSFLVSEEAASVPEGLQLYYLDPWVTLVHVGLTIPTYSRNPQRLAQALGIDSKTLDACVTSLVTLGLAEHTLKGVRILKDSVHLEKGSPFYPAWRSQLQLLGLSRCARQRGQNAMGISVVFSSNEKARNEFHTRLLELISQVQGLVAEGPFEDLYQFNVDLFRWTPEQS